MVAFHNIDEDIIKKLIVFVGWSIVEYVVVWSPNKMKSITIRLERIERAAMNMVASLRDLAWRKEKLGLDPCKREEDGDIIAVYKVIKEMGTTDRNDMLVWNTRELEVSERN